MPTTTGSNPTNSLSQSGGGVVTRATTQRNMKLRQNFVTINQPSSVASASASDGLVAITQDQDGIKIIEESSRGGSISHRESRSNTSDFKISNTSEKQ